MPRLERGRRVCNQKQFEMVEKVAYRVVEEMQAEAEGRHDHGEPLRWCLHGGPGTGKTHVINLIKDELFQGVLQWDMGIEFQIVALQAVMAELLGGDTIHHALGIPAFGRKNDCHGDDLQKHLDVAKRVLRWRWLVIDEISMVSAKLFADMELKLERVIRDIGTNKRGSRGRARPFGGLNIICSGDFWQLDPPDGGFLGDIPTEFIQAARKYQPLPTIAHGQSLFWSGTEHGIQGVTELVECERSNDVWLQNMQAEIRAGNLSRENYDLLHGELTLVPGSWDNGVLSCGKESCNRLWEDAVAKAACSNNDSPLRRHVQPES